VFSLRASKDDTALTEVMRITSSGNVGIGDATPSYKLDVLGIASVDTLNINDAYALPNYDGTVDQYLQTDGSGNLTWETIAGLDGDIEAVGDCSTGQCFNGTSGTTLTFEGATDGVIRHFEGFHLDIAGVTDSVILTSTYSNFTGILYTDSLNINDSYSLPNYDGSTNDILKTDGSGNLTWIAPGEASVAGTDHQVQYNNGGTMGGSAQLYWNDTTNTLGLWDSTPDAVFEISTPSGPARDFFYISDASDGDIFTIDSSGNVGIGDSTPNNKLQVAGLINFDDTRYNTSLGYNAGNALTTIGADVAQYNTAVGYEALLNTATQDSVSTHLLPLSNVVIWSSPKK